MTTTHYFTGIAHYPRLSRPDDYGNYSVGVTLDAASQAELKASGLTLQDRSYNGATFTTFRRPQQKLIKQELVQFGPPVVIDKNNEPVTKMVGNGSKVTVKVIAYDSMKGKGHRLEKVRVDELIEYTPAPVAPVAPGAPQTRPQPEIPF